MSTPDIYALHAEIDRLGHAVRDAQTTADEANRRAEDLEQRVADLEASLAEAKSDIRVMEMDKR